MKIQEIRDSFTLRPSILSMDVGISVFDWLYSNKEMSIYLNLSLYTGIHFVQLLNG